MRATTQSEPDTVQRGVALGVLALTYAWIVVGCALAWRFTTDDTYITLRYARHLAQGLGPVWNPGEAPVEGFSNPSFLGLATAALWMGLDPVWVCKLAGVAGLLAVPALLYALARRWLPPAPAALPGFLFVSYSGAVLWGVSGLETLVYAALVLATILLGARAMGGEAAPPSAGAAAGAALTGSLVVWTRPEGFVVAGVVAAGFALWALLRGDVVARVVAGIGGGVPLLALAVGLGLRLGVFDALVPNSVACKSAWDGDPWALLLPFGIVVGPLSVTLVWWVVRAGRDVVVLWVAAVPVAYVVGLYGADPIIGYANRHFLVAYALVAVGGVAGGFDMLQVVLKRPRPWVQAGVAAAFVLAVAAVRSTNPALLAEWGRAYAEREQSRVELSQFLEGVVPPGGSFAIGDCGLVPYLVPRRVIDVFCINTPAFLAPPVSGEVAAWAGWVLDQQPDVIVVHNQVPDALRPREEYGFFPELVSRPRFTDGYERLEAFGSEGSPITTLATFYYVVYRRRG